MSNSANSVNLGYAQSPYGYTQNYVSIPPTRAFGAVSQNNLVLTNQETAANFISISNTAAVNLTGIVPPNPANGYILTIYNAGVNNLILVNSSPLSLAANRFILPANYALAANTFIKLTYISGAWRRDSV